LIFPKLAAMGLLVACGWIMLDQEGAAQTRTERWGPFQASKDKNLDKAASPIAGGIANYPPQIWLPFLDTYRTMCIAPQPEFRGLLEQVRDLPIRGIGPIGEGRPSLR
jgi:hypothetical protein